MTDVLLYGLELPPPGEPGRLFALALADPDGNPAGIYLDQGPVWEPWNPAAAGRLATVLAAADADSAITVDATAADAADDILTTDTLTFPGGTVRVRVDLPGVYLPTGTSARCYIALYIDDEHVCGLGYLGGASTSHAMHTLSVDQEIPIDAGDHTVAIRGYCTSGGSAVVGVGDDTTNNLAAACLLRLDTL